MPLNVPEQHVTYRIVGIDPGLANLGFAIYHIDYYSGRIVKVEAFTLVNDRLPNYTGFDFETVPERTIKLHKLKGAIQWALNLYTPSYVVCEAPFYNRFMPMAYGALLEVVSTVHCAVLEWNPNIGFHTVAPLLVKKLVGTKAVKNDSLKGKELVKQGVMAIPEIMNVLETPIESLSEHAIDAIAVAYTLINVKG
jgi:Holliday junction resolvasome RuvABC endonuclease subunit